MPSPRNFSNMASTPQSPPNWGPTPPAPPGWTPPNSAPAAAPGTAGPAGPYQPFWRHEGAMTGLSRWLKVGGLALLVVGVLVAVAGASYPGSCYTSSNPCNPATGSNWMAGALTALLVGKILMVLGFAGIALGALFKMRGTPMPVSGRHDELLFVVIDRLWNGALFVVAIVLLFVMLGTVNLLPFPQAFP